MSTEALRCEQCGATWESRAAAVEIWRRGHCLACGAPMDGRTEEREEQGVPAGPPVRAGRAPEARTLRSV